MLRSRFVYAAALLAVSGSFAACGSSPEPAASPEAEPAPARVDCEKGGGLCLPNTNTAPPTYRQAKAEEGVCARRDDICWLRL